VDWDPPEAKFRNTVLLPVLEDQYGLVARRVARLGRPAGELGLHAHALAGGAAAGPGRAGEALSDATHSFRNDSRGGLATGFLSNSRK
jgi:hypothetical protein